MGKGDKALALEPLGRKEGGGALACVAIGDGTGYGRKQLGCLASETGGGADDADLPARGSMGRVPANAVADAEEAYPRRLEEPYPSIAIARFFLV